MNILEPEIYDISLPLTSLHVMQVGSGEHALMVPGTLSRLEDWVELVQFVGQYYDTYFFELPGHGQSEAFPVSYSSDLTAAAIEMLLNELNIDQVTLFGYSFGGILAMKTLHRLQERIKAVVMIAPCVGSISLRQTGNQRRLLQIIVQTLRRPRAQLNFLRILRHKLFGRLFLNLLITWGNLERGDLLEEKAQQLSLTTMDVVSCQMREILSVQFPQPLNQYQQPCYMAMSVNDPLLRFEPTEAFLKRQFANLQTLRFTHHYHQPPRRFTLSDYNQQYGHFMDAIYEDSRQSHWAYR